MTDPLDDELTGDTVREVEFRDRLRGYDPADVDPLLDDLADTIDQAREQLAQLEATPPRGRTVSPIPRQKVAQVAALLHVTDAVRRGQAIVAAAGGDEVGARGGDAPPPGTAPAQERARWLATALLHAPRPEPPEPAATVPVMERRCLLTVHAHPDDEASKGAGTIAKYHAEGVRTVLVCCTGGEAGDILNPAMDTPEVRSQLAQVRRAELDVAANVIGYDDVIMLG